MHSDIHQRLAEIGTLSDAQVPVAATLLLLAAAEREAVTDLKPYEALIVAMHDAVTLRAATNTAIADISTFRLECLRQVIHEEFGFYADSETYEELQYMDLLSVMDRRRGIPVALGSIYLELARRQGWMVVGLNFPGHFVMRIEEGAQRLLFDPYDNGKILQAADLRRLLKNVMGEKAELHHHYYDAVSARDVILRFCNNRKTRLIAREEYEPAMRIILNEMRVAPDESRLLFEAGILSARLHHIQKATEYLGLFIERSDDKQSIAEAKDVLLGLRRLLQ